MADQQQLHPDEASALLPKQLQRSSDPPPDRFTRSTSRAGYVYMVLATAGFGAMVLLLRVAESRLSMTAAPALLIRSVLQTSLSAALLQFLPRLNGLQAIPSATRPWLILRGIFGASGILMHTAALARIPAGDATAIFFTVPVFTMIFCYLLIGEPVSRVDVAAAFLSVLGGVLVGLPNDPSVSTAIPARDRVIGSCLSLGAAAMAGLAYTIIRKLGTSIHFLATVLAQGACAIPLSLAFGGAFNPFTLDSTGRLALLVTFASAASAFIGQLALSRGLQLSKAGPALLLRNLDVPIVYAISIFALGEAPTLLRGMGATIIVLAAVMIAVKKIK